MSEWLAGTVLALRLYWESSVYGSLSYHRFVVTMLTMFVSVHSTLLCFYVTDSFHYCMSSPFLWIQWLYFHALDYDFYSTIALALVVRDILRTTRVPLIFASVRYPWPRQLGKEGRDGSMTAFICSNNQTINLSIVWRCLYRFFSSRLVYVDEELFFISVI